MKIDNHIFQKLKFIIYWQYLTELIFEYFAIFFIIIVNVCLPASFFPNIYENMAIYCINNVDITLLSQIVNADGFYVLPIPLLLRYYCKISKYLELNVRLASQYLNKNRLGDNMWFNWNILLVAVFWLFQYTMGEIEPLGKKDTLLERRGRFIGLFGYLAGRFYIISQIFWRKKSWLFQ